MAIKDFTFTVDEGSTGVAQQKAPSADTGAPNGGGTVHVKKGEIQSMVTRLASQIVDAPGQTS